METIINSITTIPLNDCRIEVIDIFSILHDAKVQAEQKHSHSFYELHIIKKGVSKLMIDEKFYETREGSLIIIPKDAYHYAVENDDGFRFGAFNFDIVKEKNKNRNSKQEYAYFMNVFDTKEPIVISMNGTLTSIYNQMAELADCFDIYSVNKLHLKIAEFFLEVVHIVSKNTIKKDDGLERGKYGEEAIRKQKFEQLLTNQLTYKLEDFANELYLSPRQLERFLMKVYGKTFKDLIMQNKMVRCVQMIKENKYSLSEIATKLGFSSYGGFLYAYKRYYGKNPVAEEKGKN